MSTLVCPSTRQTLVPASAEQFAALQSARNAGTLRNGAGELPEVFEAALVTSDGVTVYPVRGGIPVLLEAEGMPTSPA